MEKERIIEAYDKALNELNRIQEEVDSAIAKARKALLEGRQKALTEASSA